jgi:carbonic anhydrase
MGQGAIGRRYPAWAGLRRAAPWLAAAFPLAVFPLICLVLTAAPAAATADAPAPAWGYTGATGPDHWAGLSDDYRNCAEGHEQSPIDIGRTFHASSAAPRMLYFPAPLQVVNDGHTVEVDYGPGSTLVTDGKTYDLVQVRFHSPSEHRIEGKAYAMEADLMHRAEDGSLAEVAVFLEPGAANPFLDRVWPAVPAEVGKAAPVPGAPLSAADLVPGRSGFLYYEGSLTTPPCSEGVRWFVMDTPGTVSKAQVDRFLALVHENARPVQPLNGRQVEHRM